MTRCKFGYQLTRMTSLPIFGTSTTLAIPWFFGPWLVICAPRYLVLMHIVFPLKLPQMMRSNEEFLHLLSLAWGMDRSQHQTSWWSCVGTEDFEEIWWTKIWQSWFRQGIHCATRSDAMWEGETKNQDELFCILDGFDDMMNDVS